MELNMGIIKVEFSVPEVVKAISAFKNNRLKALEHFSNEVRESASHTINQLLNAEMTLFLGEKDQSNNKRNGYKERDYTLKGIGTVRLNMPQDRNSSFTSSIVPKN
ncbi:MAG: transposase, partial [Bacteriovoracaceae bacterium]|nr:transposase [Bacteriovoracaceae bacterium]